MPQGGRTARNSKLSHDVRKIINELKANGQHPTIFDVVGTLKTYSTYQRKNEAMLKKIVAKEMEKLKGADKATLDKKTMMQLVDSLVVPKPERSNSPTSSSLLNQNISGNYAAIGATKKDTPKQEKRKSNNSNKRNRDGTSRSKPAKGMYMGTKTPDVEGAIANALSAGSFLSRIPNKSFRDVAGIDDVQNEVLRLIGYSLEWPEVFQHLGVPALHGVLLKGPSGCGKTLMGEAIAGEMGYAIGASMCVFALIQFLTVLTDSFIARDVVTCGTTKFRHPSWSLACRANQKQIFESFLLQQRKMVKVQR